MSLISGLLIDGVQRGPERQQRGRPLRSRTGFCQKGGERPEEQEHLAGAITGQLLANSWHKQDQPVTSSKSRES